MTHYGRCKLSHYCRIVVALRPDMPGFPRFCALGIVTLLPQNCFSNSLEPDTEEGDLR